MVINTTYRSNCTLLELKVNKLALKLNNLKSSNCTLLELKEVIQHKSDKRIEVLIVPYWN